MFPICRSIVPSAMLPERELRGRLQDTPCVAVSAVDAGEAGTAGPSVDLTFQYPEFRFVSETLTLEKLF